MQHQRLIDMPPTVRFDLVIDQICNLLFYQSFRAPLLFMLLHHRARRTQRRFAALVAKLQAGITLAPLKPRVMGPRRPKDAVTAGNGETESGEAASAAPASAAPRIPSAFCWLTRFLPTPPLGEGLFLGGCGSALHDFLQAPTTQPIIAAAPDRLGRLLRPLARMFGTILPETLQLPKRKRTRRTAETTAPRPRAPRKPRVRTIPRLCDPLPAVLPPAPAPVAPPATPFEPSLPPPVWQPAPGPPVIPDPRLPPLAPGYRYDRIQHITGEVFWAVLRRMDL